MSSIGRESCESRLKDVLFKFRPKPATKTTTKTVAKYSFDTVVPQFQDKLFQIQFDHNPLQEWKILNGCSIITCEYFIESFAYVSNCRLPTTNITKLTLGTVSLQNEEGGSETTLTAKSIKDGDIVEEIAVPVRDVPIREEKSRELSPIQSIGSGINWSADLGDIPDVDVELAHLSFLDDPRKYDCIARDSCLNQCFTSFLATALFPDHHENSTR